MAASAVIDLRPKPFESKPNNIWIAHRIGAGGVVCGFGGEDLGDTVVNFQSGQTPVILAANPKIADELVRRLTA